MASTAWTATREELVKALADARAERELIATRLQAQLAKEAHRKALKRDRDTRWRQRHNVLAQADAIAAEAITPPDPNAARHRADLIAALKEKP